MAATKSFYFDGSKDKSLSLDVDLENINELAGLQEVIGTSFAVVKPQGEQKSIEQKSIFKVETLTFFRSLFLPR
jgi:hypothetical protein